MKSIERIERSKNIKPSTPSPKTGSSRARRQMGRAQAEDGESIRVKILDHLGGGKLIVDLKGERVVANTPLPLEKNQEIDVTVRNTGDKIILQLVSDSNQSMSLEPPATIKLSLADAISQLIVSLRSVGTAEPSTSAKQDALHIVKELAQKVQELASRITVKVAEGDLTKQVRDAVNTLGYDYERKLADALVNGRPLAMDDAPQLKAKLMQLRSILTEEVFQNRDLQAALLESIDSLLEGIEFQQLKSILHSDRFQHFYFQIPFFLEGRTATAAVEFFRPKQDDKQDDNSFNIVLNFDLERLGHMEFAISVIDKHINCQIKADEYETYELAKKHSEELEGRLTALGYSVGGIHCTIGNPEARMEQLSQTGMDDIDITV